MIDQTWYTRPPDVPERTSAGGVVLRHDGRQWLVALAREAEFTQFVLPKGGVKKGETFEQAARREIEEEAGLTGLKLIAALGALSRLNYAKTRWMTVHYFLFTAADAGGRPSDRRKHPHPARWFPLNRLPTMLWPEQCRLLEGRRDELLRLAEQHG
jgi:8-oxo-dGTP pyrophosphatase MutT (NUDIX family)